MLSCNDNTTTSTFIPTEYGTVTDIDGNVYKTVKIGTQWWMAENLSVSRYCNGDSIPDISDSAQWVSLITGARCNYGKDTSMEAIYGKLYNWYSVNDSRGLAPIGWHVPSINEWTILTDYLGGSNVAGGKMKEAGISHWQSPNTGATNESGFSALPGGYRYYEGSFDSEGESSCWWSSSIHSGTLPLSWGLNYFHPYIGWNFGNRGYGFSVRCIKD